MHFRDEESEEDNDKIRGKRTEKLQNYRNLRSQERSLLD